MNQLKSLLSNRRATFLVFLCILAVYGLSFYKRQTGYAEWMENRDDYVVEQVTAMSTKDAYHWVKMAKDMDAGKLKKGEPDPLKGYPDLEDYPKSPSLLATCISTVSRFTDGDYYRAGLLLVPLLAGLFVFPLFLYFHTLGFGASAVLGGLIGSFSVAYHSRSNHGYVDTDMLNTFFPMLVSALIVLIGRERPFRGNLLLAISAGIVMHLFNWWYQQPAFFLVYLLFIAVYLFLMQLPPRQVLCLLLAFTLASGPQHVLQSVASLKNFLYAYFFSRSSGQIVWPDIMTTIIEAQKHDILTKLLRVHEYLPVVLVGLIGLLYLYTVHWRRMMPITPLILIGLWSLVGPRRFTMYLAPFIGIGAGVLIELLAKQLGARLCLNSLATPLVAIALMLTLFFSTTGYTAFNVVPGPSVPTATTKAFLEIKRVVPKHSAMFTWWDNGYPLMEIGEFATYHDNGSLSHSRATLVGKAMVSERQDQMVSLLAYLEEFGFSGLDLRIVDENLSGDQMIRMVFSHPRSFRGEKVYVLYTEDLIEKFRSISMFGTWDFNQKTSDPMDYQYLTCFSLVDNILNCRGGKADLNRGILTDGNLSFPLKAALFVNDGTIVNRYDYPVAEGDYLQILLQKGQLYKVQVIEERLFRTNFNQQYLLGNYDRRYFEEVYNNFPVARVFKVKTAGAGVR